MFTLNFGSTF